MRRSGSVIGTEMWLTCDPNRCDATLHPSADIGVELIPYEQNFVGRNSALVDSKLKEPGVRLSIAGIN